VGPIVAAAYVLTLGQPDAASNRSAGAFLGLRPAQSQSGAADPQRRISKTGGKRGKKRAIIAVARKLAVVLHALWRSGQRFQPFPQQVALAA